MVTRALAPTDRGELATAMALPLLVSLPLAAGLDLTNLQFASSCPGLARRQSHRTVLRSSAVAVGLALFTWLTDATLLGLDRDLLALACMTVGPVVAVQAYGSLLLGLRRYAHWSASQLAPAGGLLIVDGVIIALGRSSPLTFFIAFVLAQLAAATVCAAGANVGEGVSEGWESGGRDRIARYARRSWLQAVSFTLMLRLPIPLASLTLGSAGAAFVAVSAPLTESLLLVPASVGTVLHSAMVVTSAPRAQAQTNSWMLRSLAIVVSPAIVLVLFAEPVVVSLYGASYAPAAVVVGVVTPAVTLFGLGRISVSYLAAFEGISLVAGIAVAGLLVSLLVQLTLPFLWGITGTSIGIACGYLVSGLLLLQSYRMRTRD